MERRGERLNPLIATKFGIRNFLSDTGFQPVSRAWDSRPAYFAIGFLAYPSLILSRMNSNQELEKPVSVGDWIFSLIVLSIPIVGFIITLVWAFGGTPSTSKRNFCRASLFFLLLFIALGLLFLFAFGGLAALSNLSSSMR